MASALRKIFGIAYTKPEDRGHESDEAARKKRRRSSTVDIHGQSNTEHSITVSDETNSDDSLNQPSPKPSDSKKQRIGSPHGDPSNNLPLEKTPKKLDLRLDQLENCDFDKDVLDFGSSPSEVDSDVDSISEFDTSFEIDKSNVQLCRKVSKTELDDEFSDLEDRNDDQRLGLLLSYQMRIEKLDRLLKTLLTEFKFHIEVSKIFNTKNHVATLPGSDMNQVSKILGTVKQIERLSRRESLTGSWNLIVEKEDTQSKLKVKDQLLSIKAFIQDFVDTHLNNTSDLHLDVPSGNSTMTEKSEKKNLIQLKIPHMRYKVNRRKYERKMCDFPDLREILHNLFMLEDSSINASVSGKNVTTLLSDVEEQNSHCTCNCLEHRPDSAKSSDSGLPTKQSSTISSSIGDFSLDNSQLTAYSESLEQVLSYNSFEDSSLISSMLQKCAIERIKFYVQVHNIQMTTEQGDHPSDTSTAQSTQLNKDNLNNSDQSTTTLNEESSISKRGNVNYSTDSRRILFNCAACNFNTPDEKGMLRHILDQNHCEKLHFLYKTAYIRRCFSTGQEIQPSTVLNSMIMYRDDNKIVCFGDNKFACSLCLLSDIVGESVLMSHCQQSDHVDRRNKLRDTFQHVERQ